MKIRVELTETDLRALVIERLAEMVHAEIQEKDVSIEVKSKHNYKAEWEQAAFRAWIEISR